MTNGMDSENTASNSNRTPWEIGLSVDKLIDWNKVTENSVLILKANQDVFENMVLALQDISHRYKDQLREKNISVLLIDKNSDVELLSQEDMGRLGWQRKSKLVI